MSNATEVSRRTLYIVRTALFAGVAVFGLIVWRLLPGDSFGTLEPAVARILTGVFYALCAFAVIATIFLRSASSRSATYSGRASLAIAAWALTEGVAFFGGILWILTGRPGPYLIGATLFVLAATAVPVPSDEPAV